MTYWGLLRTPPPQENFEFNVNIIEHSVPNTKSFSYSRVL